MANERQANEKSFLSCPLLDNMIPPKTNSPLFRIKRILLILRWLLGFPLKAENEEFNEFTFRPCLEYSRHALFLIIFLAPQFYIQYLFASFEGNANFFEATQNYITEALGFSILDIVIVMWLPCICSLSTTFYMFSFKNKSKEISQICLKMTNIKDILEEYLASFSLQTIKSKVKISLTLFIIAILFSSVTVTFYCISNYQLINQILVRFFPLSWIQIWLMTISMAISAFCWVYPMISISADMVTCHIMEEMGDIYLTWNNVLAFGQRHNDTVHESPNEFKLIKENENLEKQR